MKGKIGRLGLLAILFVMWYYEADTTTAPAWVGIVGAVGMAAFVYWGGGKHD